MKSWLFVALALVVLALWAIACERTADVTRQYRPRVEAQLARLRAAVKAAEAQPNGNAPALAVPLVFGGNALLVSRESLQDPPELATHDLVAAHDLLELVRDRLAAPRGTPAELRRVFDRFLAVRYVAVVRTYSFDGAAWAGAIQILDLETGASAGTIAAEARAADAPALYGEAKRAIAAALAPLVAPGTSPF